VGITQERVGMGLDLKKFKLELLFINCIFAEKDSCKSFWSGP